MLAFNAADEEEKSFWRRTLEDQEQKKGDFRRAVGMLEKSGALTATIERARDYGAKAHQALEPFPDSEIKTGDDRSRRIRDPSQLLGQTAPTGP